MQKGCVLAPDKLGKLLVAVESNCRQSKVDHITVKDIFRLGLTIAGYKTSGGGPLNINVISQFSAPFMENLLNTPEYDQILTKMIHKFDKVKTQVERLGANHKSSQLVANPEIAKLMKSVMDPFLDKFFGKDRSFASAGMPDQLKRLLLALDKEIIRWFEQSGSGQPRDLLDARRNALIGFLSPRSISPVWTEKIEKQFGANRGPYVGKMIAYMNSYIAKNMGAFIDDFLISQPDQSSSQRSYVETIGGRKTLQTKARVPKLELPTSILLGQEKNLKNMTGGTPRTALSSRGQSASTNHVQNAAKMEKERAMQRKNERAKLVDQIAKDCQLDVLDHNFYQYLKEYIINSPARGYDNFKRDPIPSCIRRAEAWYGKPENAGLRVRRVDEQVIANLEKQSKTYLSMDAKLKEMNLSVPSNPFDDDGSDTDEPTGPAQSADKSNQIQQAPKNDATESSHESAESASASDEASGQADSGTASSDERSASQ